MRFLLVHGFRQSLYNISEGNRLDTQFALNVVGTTQLVAFVFSGTITAEADGTASEKHSMVSLYLVIHFDYLSRKV